MLSDPRNGREERHTTASRIFSSEDEGKMDSFFPLFFLHLRHLLSLHLTDMAAAA